LKDVGGSVNISNIEYAYDEGIIFARARAMSHHKPMSERILKEKMNGWLRTPDPSNTHNRLQDEHHEGTGQWFLESIELMMWLKNMGSTLWIKGLRKFVFLPAPGML
jgi:hypothetical protein